MFDKIGEIFKKTFVKEDGSWNWKGILWTGGGAVAGTLLTGNPLVGIPLGGGVGMWANHTFSGGQQQEQAPLQRPTGQTGTTGDSPNGNGPGLQPQQNLPRVGQGQMGMPHQR